MPDAYTRPPHSSWPAITPRTLLPIYPPPEPLKKPNLPSSPRQPSFASQYILSTHLVPAAYLRTTEYIPEPPLVPSDATKAERQEHAIKTGQKLRDIRGSLEPRGEPQILWNCINRYVRIGWDPARKPGITLFLAHANGFPKEIWEPTLDHLLTSPACLAIDEVWAWESVQHGDACLINSGKLGGVFDWADNARDILNFLLYFLPSQATPDPLPSHLPRVGAVETELRRQDPFTSRRLVAVGHSFGGCSSVLAAANYPHLFSSIILVDPVVVKPTGVLPAFDEGVTKIVIGALTRRETWSSQEEALQLFRKSGFFGTWDPEALRLYVECGTYATINPVTGEAAIALKTPGIQEAVVFSDNHSRCEAYHILSRLDKRIELRWIMPGDSRADEFGPPGARRERVWVRPENASNIRISNAGHLIPQEQPRLLSNDIQEFILQRYMATPSLL